MQVAPLAFRSLSPVLKQNSLLLRRYTEAIKPPPGQPEVLKVLDKTIGNKYFLHLFLPAVITLNGLGHLAAPLPEDTYWLPACYWLFSVVSVPLLMRNRPARVWHISVGIHVVNGFLYSQVIGKIWQYGLRAARGEHKERMC